MSNEILSGPDRISFYWTVSELLNTDSMFTLYTSESKITESGQLLVDELSLTVDEEDIFLTLLKDAVYEVFSRFLKYTKGITDAIKFNVAYTPTGGSANNSVVLQIVKQTGYNSNILNSVDLLLEKSIRYYVLREWFSIKDLNTDAEKAGMNYVAATNDLLHYSLKLKQPGIVF